MAFMWRVIWDRGSRFAVRGSRDGYQDSLDGSRAQRAASSQKPAATLHFLRKRVAQPVEHEIAE